MEKSMEFNGIPLNFHAIPLNFMKLRLMEFHEKFHGIPWNSIEFHGISSIDGI
jgi:hypothetical protein